MSIVFSFNLHDNTKNSNHCHFQLTSDGRHMESRSPVAIHLICNRAGAWTWTFLALDPGSYIDFPVINLTSYLPCILSCLRESTWRQLLAIGKSSRMAVLTVLKIWLRPQEKGSRNVEELRLPYLQNEHECATSGLTLKGGETDYWLGMFSMIYPLLVSICLPHNIPPLECQSSYAVEEWGAYLASVVVLGCWVGNMKPPRRWSPILWSGSCISTSCFLHWMATP